MIFRLIIYLKENNIDFCVINGYKEIVNGINDDSDNDILFKKKDFKNIDAIIKTFSTENGLYVVQSMHQEVLAKNFFVFDPKSEEFLNLDLYGELSRKDVIIFEEKDVFSSLETYDGIPILSPEKEFTNYVIKKLDKNNLTKESFEYLRQLYSKNQQLCDVQIRRFFSNNYVDIQKAFQTDSFHLISNNQKKIIKDIYILKKFNLKKEIINLLRICIRILKPTGLTIGFLGPDGSGKSTIIDGILEKRLPFRRKDYFHLKPIQAVDRSKSITVDEPHLMPLYSKTKSYIKLLYFIYQYNFGWLKNVSKLKIKSSLIIFDRYFDDMLVDNKRYRYGGNTLLAKFARYFIPKPDIYFILTTDAKIIYERKQEVIFEELQRQVKEYKTLADNKRYFNIDVGQEPKEIVKEINKIMMEKMNERY